MNIPRNPRRGDVLKHKTRRVRVVKVRDGMVVLENLETGNRSVGSVDGIRRMFNLDKHNTNRGRAIQRTEAQNQGRPPKALDVVIAALLEPEHAPTAVELGARANVSTRTIYRYLDKLEAEGRLETIKPDDPHEPFRYSLKSDDEPNEATT